MNTLERTRHILDLLSETSEQLKAYADDLWLNVDRSTHDSIQQGADEQKEFLTAQTQFSVLTSDLEALIRDDLGADARERIDGVSEGVRDKLVVELDRSIPHRLDEMFTFKRPYAIRLQDNHVGQQNTWKGIYRWLLQTLAAEHPDAFQQLVDSDIALTSRGNRSIARNKADVRSYIEVAGLYFEANLSANFIRDKMTEVLQELDYTLDDVHIYLREDRDGDGAQ